MATPSPAVVVGAGPAGLATAACLRRRGIEPTVLEAGPSVGSSWRRHYRRLHLHTVKEHSSLPGLPFPEGAPRYPSRADVVSYLDAYAARFGIVPRTAEPVRRISLVDGVLTVESDRGAYRARRSGGRHRPLARAESGTAAQPGDLRGSGDTRRTVPGRSALHRSARAGRRRRQHWRRDRARSRRARRDAHVVRPNASERGAPGFPRDTCASDEPPDAVAAARHARSHRALGLVADVRRPVALRAAAAGARARSHRSCCVAGFPSSTLALSTPSSVVRSP